MLTLGDLQMDPTRFAELEGSDVLVAVSSGSEVVLRDAPAVPEATVVFRHETIAMMRAERQDRIDKLKKQLGASSAVVPIKKKPGSFWDQITVGRASTADISLEDPAVSNVHAHLQESMDGCGVQDLGSSNGTFLNRGQLQPHELTPLRSGDCLRFGQTVFYYVSSSMLKELL